MDRYNQIVSKAQERINDYDIEGCKRWLSLAQTRRDVFSIEPSLVEFEVREALQITESEYPVPEGLKRREPYPGCGDPNCDACYQSK